MAGKTFQLDIVTPEGAEFGGAVESLVVSAHEGYLGVLAGHAPLLCELRPGAVRFAKEGTTEVWSLTGGFLEVSSGKAIILADAVEKLDEIDIERATRARDRARKLLQSPDPSVDRDRAQKALDRAESRLRLAGVRQS